MSSTPVNVVAVFFLVVFFHRSLHRTSLKVSKFARPIVSLRPPVNLTIFRSAVRRMRSDRNAVPRGFFVFVFVDFEKHGTCSIIRMIRLLTVENYSINAVYSERIVF